MSVRLIQVSKDLNVGINSLVEFLQKEGFDIPSNPNTKIDSDKHEMLVKEFGKASDLEAFRKRQAEKEAKQVDDVIRESSEEKVVETTAPQEEAEEKVTSTDVKTEIPQSLRPQVQIVDKIDLDALNKPKKVVKKAGEQVVTEKEVSQKEYKKPEEPKEEQVESPKVEEPKKEVLEEKEVIAKEVAIAKEEPRAENKKEGYEDDGVFRLRDSSIESNIVVKGTIDLSAINDKTRPAKKSKAERKKERQDRELEQRNVKALKKDEEQLRKVETKDEDENAKKKKRSRIKKGRVDIEKGVSQAPTTDAQQKKKGRKTLNKPAVSEEDVQKTDKRNFSSFNRQ